MRSAIDQHRHARNVPFFALMIGVFLGGGLLNSVEALLVPRLKLTLHLGYAEALLVQLAYYASYLLFAYPAMILVTRGGPMLAVTIGLATIAGGCFLVAGVLAAQFFAVILAALLLVSCGVTILQIACNGLVATQGRRDQATARFTLLQGFNSLGTVIGPLAGAWLLLGGQGGLAPLIPFLGFGALFGMLALGFAGHRPVSSRPEQADPPRAYRFRVLLRTPRIAWGAAAIFAYVGAEVTVGTLAVNYLMLPTRTALTAVTAGRLVSLYWCGAMIGRFAGAWLLRRASPPSLLGIAAIAALCLVFVAILPSGAIGSVALLTVGLANSIMFPTIFALAMPARADDMPLASMLMCMAVVGGAIVPMITGLVADSTNLPLALVVPMLCYGVVLAAAWTAARSGDVSA